MSTTRTRPAPLYPGLYLDGSVSFVEDDVDLVVSWFPKDTLQ